MQQIVQPENEREAVMRVTILLAGAVLGAGLDGFAAFSNQSRITHLVLTSIGLFLLIYCFGVLIRGR